jgi:hypothetical protein
LDALLTVIIAFGFFTGTFLLHRIYKLKQAEKLLLIENFRAEIKSVLSECILKTPTDRGILINFHNGGGLITLKTNKYISVCFEKNTPRLPAIIEDWQRVPADEEYLMFVQKLLKDKMVVLQTSRMQPGKLKRAYTTAGITSSIVLLLIQNETNIIYLSFSSVGDFQHFVTPEVLSHLEIKAARVTNVLLEAEGKNLLKRLLKKT